MDDEEHLMAQTKADLSHNQYHHRTQTTNLPVILYLKSKLNWTQMSVTLFDHSFITDQHSDISTEIGQPTGKCGAWPTLMRKGS